MRNLRLMKPIAGAIAAACLIAAPAAQAAGTALAEIEEAEQALAGEPGLDPSAELIDVAAILPSLEGIERRRARAVLARPPAGAGGSGEPFGGGWSQDAIEAAPYPSPGGQFLIHWVTTTGDAPILTDISPANGVPDYVDTVAAFADRSAQVQNGDLGWPAPKPDGSKGGDARTDIYLSDLCDPGPGACVFGYAGPDDSSSQCTRPPFRCFAYLVLDNDYSTAEYEHPDPLIPLQVTAAHEYNHVLQFRLDARQDQWLFESTAVWMEEQVFPDADDWLHYIERWARGSRAPLTKAGASGGFRIYGSAVWHHWLDRGAGYGPGIVLDAWRRSRQGNPKDFGAGAYDRAIQARGGRDFSKEFVRFAAATSEWRTGAGGFPDAEGLSDVKRSGTLRIGRRVRRGEIDHTAYRLLRVRPPASGGVRLHVRAPRGTKAGIALVARTGTATTGTVTTKLKNLRRGRASVRLANAGAFDRVTAVLVNADGRVRSYSQARGDWIYKRDNVPFTFSLTRR